MHSMHLPENQSDLSFGLSVKTFIRLLHDGKIVSFLALGLLAETKNLPAILTTIDSLSYKLWNSEGYAV